MPPKARITRDMILDAAFDLVRAEGHEALNVRTLAKRLGCSTQPIPHGLYPAQGWRRRRRSIGAGPQLRPLRP